MNGAELWVAVCYEVGKSSEEECYNQVQLVTDCKTISTVLAHQASYQFQWELIQLQMARPGYMHLKLMNTLKINYDGKCIFLVNNSGLLFVSDI